MTDNDRNVRNEETEKLMAYQRDRDLQRRGVKIDEAIQGITDDDRKMLINKCLRKVDARVALEAAIRDEIDARQLFPAPSTRAPTKPALVVAVFA